AMDEQSASDVPLQTSGPPPARRTGPSLSSLSVAGLRHVANAAFALGFDTAVLRRVAVECKREGDVRSRVVELHEAPGKQHRFSLDNLPLQDHCVHAIRLNVRIDNSLADRAA